MSVTQKKQLRKNILQERNLLDEVQLKEKSNEIMRQILSLPTFLTSSTIMIYFDFKAEVETGGLAHEILKAGKRLVAPLCIGQDIVAYEVLDISEDVSPGMFGIREPRPDKCRLISPAEIDLVLVPGVAFDNKGNRIGYGRGYYDRFLPQLKKNCFVIGLAFSCQLVEKIEVEAHDIKMSLLVTENGVIYPE